MNVLLELTRIVQAAALADSPTNQVKLIVEAIHQAIRTDVCSLYLTDTQGDMLLAASHGLDTHAVGKVRLPAGKGLVGLVVESRHPINIADAVNHPAYYYIAETKEENFRSFCGVPLVRAGEVIGVLVVQSRQARLLSEEEQAFLVTLGTQLALVVSDNPISAEKRVSSTYHLKGIKGAPGIGIGQVHLCESAGLASMADSPCENIDASVQQWRQLLEKVHKEIEEERHALSEDLSESVGSIFTAYQILLADPALIKGVESTIKAGHWLPGALRQVVQQHADLFLGMDDPYLRARHEDIWHLGNKLFNAWRGSDSSADLSGVGPWVLVGSQVSVSDIASVAPGKLAGIVCFEGSSMSHTAVLANALGIPAVMGVGALRGTLLEGEALIVDGNQGQIVLNPSSSVRSEFQQLIDEEQQLWGKLQQLRDLPAITTDGQRIRLFANTGLLADISPGLASGAEGVGLYRTEIPFMVRDGFPSEDEQEHIYRQVLSAYPDKTVYMRTLDIGGDKPLPYFPINEENPALGWRGIRFSLDNSQLLMTQLRAMIRAADGSENLHILLPMVSSTHELTAFHRLLNDACQQLRSEGLALSRPKTGIMVEVPAAISQLSLWAPWLDFISIGSNDLSQYLLALDRNNARVSAAYDHVHPAVVREISRIVEYAKTLKLPLSLCGEMASDPIAVTLLVGLGIRTLSMSAAKLPRIKWLIRNLSVSHAQALATHALTLDSAYLIRTHINEALKALDLGALIK